MQRYSAPQRLPPQSRLRCQKNQCALSRLGFDRSVPRTLRPPWQGEARGCALLQSTATIPTKSSIHQPNLDASETERTRTTIVRMQSLPKAEYPTDASAHKQGVQGGTPWRFPPAFSEKAGKNQGSFALDLIEQSPGLFDPPGRAPVRRGHPQGVALTNYITVEPQTVRSALTHSPGRPDKPPRSD